MSVGILGSYSSRFGKLENSTIYDLIVEAGRGAIADAGIAAKEIDAIWIGNFNSGSFNNQEHLASWAVEIDPALLYKPCAKEEAACASGSAAVRAARLAIGSGEARFVLVIGVEKMTALDRDGVTHALAMASYWPEEGSKGMTFPGMFGMWSQAYREHYGYSDDSDGPVASHGACQEPRQRDTQRACAYVHEAEQSGIRSARVREEPSDRTSSQTHGLLSGQRWSGGHGARTD